MLKNVLLLLSIFTVWSCNPGNPQKLSIAGAANVQYALNEIVAAFEQETGISCHTITSSSGKLTAQINEGAPYDIFISADMKYPQSLYESGKAEQPPRVYAEGVLVLWSFLNKDTSAVSLDGLTSQAIRHIAIANPRTAPYGSAAEEVLKYHGLWEKVQSKLVYGESISQTTQFIMTGAAETGFTAKSVVLSETLAGQGAFKVIDPEQHTPILQGIVSLSGGPAPKTYRDAFMAFMFSDKVKTILDKYGYKIPE